MESLWFKTDIKTSLQKKLTSSPMFKWPLWKHSLSGYMFNLTKQQNFRRVQIQGICRQLKDD